MDVYVYICDCVNMLRFLKLNKTLNTFRKFELIPLAFPLLNIVSKSLPLFIYVS